MKILQTKRVNQLVELEARICNGIQSQGSFSEGQTNIFGREVLHSPLAGISWALGLASSGFRCTVIIHCSQLESILPQIRMAARDHIPLTISVAYDTIYPAPTHVPGVVELVSTHSQNTIEKAAISHRIAEMGLCPVIHWFEVRESEANPKLLDSVLYEFNEPAETFIDSCTPSQRILFGERRNLIPQISHLDLPGLIGTTKDIYSLSIEKAANQVFFEKHVLGLIDEVFTEFESISGSSHTHVETYGLTGVKKAIIGAGIFSSNQVLPAEDLTIGYVTISSLTPFPSEELKALMAPIQRLGYFDSVLSLNNSLANSVNGIYKGKEFISGYYSRNSEKALGSFAKQLSKRKPPSTFYSDLPFDISSQDVPDLKLLLQSVKANYDDLTAESESYLDGVIEESEVQKPKMGKEIGPSYSQLARFHNTTGVLVNNGADKLIVEPFQALPYVPASSSWWNNESGLRTSIPQFNMQKCSGCGDCLSDCPFMALPSRAVTIANVIETASKQLSEIGSPIKILIPQIRNLASIASGIVYNREENEEKALSEIIEEAFEKLIAKLKWENDKSSDARKELIALQSHLPVMPYAITEFLFDIPESQDNGTGEFLFIGLDPNKCTGCGICVDSCMDEAIELVEESGATIMELTAQLKEFRQFPDTSSPTINRLLADEQYSSLNALMLSESFYGSMISHKGDTSIPARMTLHAITSIVESIYQPRYSDYLETLNDLHERLSEQIHSILSGALPKEDFSDIDKALKSTSHHKVTLDEILNTSSSNQPKIDRDEVQRKIELNHSVQNLSWLLREGPGGNGRSRYAITMTSTLSDSIQYPENPFDCPVMVNDSASAPSYIIGYMQGHFSRVIDNLKLMRKASLESRGKYNSKLHDKEIAALKWETLTDEERKLIPPVLLITDALELTGQWRDLHSLFQTGLPVKVVILNDLSADPRQSLDPSDLIVFFREVYQYHGSLSDKEDFYGAINQAIALSAPALFHLMVPKVSSMTHSSTAIMDIMALAKDCRVFPTISYRPSPDKSLAQCIDLSRNTDLDKLTVTCEMPEAEKEENLSWELTWADFAHNFKEWTSFFNETDKMEDPVTVSECIANGSGLATIYQFSGPDKKRITVNKDMIEMSEAVIRQFKMLLEIAGWKSNDPEELKERILSDLAGAYEEKLRSQQEEFEQRIHSEKEQQVEDLRGKLRDKLVQLANKKGE